MPTSLKGASIFYCQHSQPVAYFLSIMSLTHITSQSLRHLLSLTERKEQFLKDIVEVENEIAKALKGAATSVVEAAEAVTPFKPAKKSKGKKYRKAKASNSAGLKERILALLHDAGDQGLRVKEIAEKLAAKPANISVWFSTTGKKLAKKIEPGRYAVKGAKKSAATSSRTVTGYLKPPASIQAEIKKAAKKSNAKPAPVTPVAKKPVKAKKRKSGITPEGRARLAANMKARWAARKAGKSAAKVGKPSKKGFKLPKAGKNPF